MMTNATPGAWGELSDAENVNIWTDKHGHGHGHKIYSEFSNSIFTVDILESSCFERREHDLSHTRLKKKKKNPVRAVGFRVKAKRKYLGSI